MGQFCTLPILDFSFFQLEKVFRDLKWYKNPGLGMKFPTPTPQSWKHAGNLAKSRKYPENLAEAWKLWQKICTYSMDHCRTDF
jgi:hypothetical protein